MHEPVREAGRGEGGGCGVRVSAWVCGERVRVCVSGMCSYVVVSVVCVCVVCVCEVCVCGVWCVCVCVCLVRLWCVRVCVRVCLNMRMSE